MVYAFALKAMTSPGHANLLNRFFHLAINLNKTLDPGEAGCVCFSRHKAAAYECAPHKEAA
jgi:hypothetical protein